jgi:O-antigen/teichoic acid export membrane protein
MSSVATELERIRSSPLARNAGWMLAGQGANLVLQAGYFVLLGRLLGSMQYGIFVGAFAFTSLLATFSAMGSGTLLLRYVSTERGAFAAYWGNVLLTTTVFSTALLAAATIVAPHLLNPSSTALVLLAGISNCFFNELTRNAAAVFQAYERMRTTAALNLATNLIRLIGAASMLLLLGHATAFQWASVSVVVSGMATIASLVCVTRRYGMPALSLHLLFAGIPEGFGYSFASSAASVYNDIDKTMLSHYGLNAQNGIYALAYRVIDMATIPAMAVRDAAVPRFFREGTNNRRELWKLTFRLMKRSLVVTGVLGAGLYVSSGLIPLLVGESFRSSAQAVRWLCLIPMLRCVHQMTGAAVMGLGLQKYRTATQMVVAGFNFVLNLWWIPAYGWKGAAGSSLLSDAMLAVLNTIVLAWLCKEHE